MCNVHLLYPVGIYPGRFRVSALASTDLLRVRSPCCGIYRYGAVFLLLSYAVAQLRCCSVSLLLSYAVAQFRCCSVSLFRVSRTLCGLKFLVFFPRSTPRTAVEY